MYASSTHIAQPTLPPQKNSITPQKKEKKWIKGLIFQSRRQEKTPKGEILINPPEPEKQEITYYLIGVEPTTRTWE